MQGSLRLQRGRATVMVAAVLALAAVAAVMLATSGASTAAAAPAKAAAAKAPVYIGVSCDCSGGPTSSTTQGFAPAMDVWAKWINGKGGIDGHQVKLVHMDTKTDPTGAKSVAKALIANKKLIAIIPGSGQGSVISDQITKGNIAFVGGLAIDPTWGTNKNVFSVSTTSPQFASVLAAVGAKYAKNKNGADLYCAEVESCKLSLPLFGAGVKKKGGKLVYSAAISSSAPDYTAPCLAVKASGAGYMWVAEGVPQIIAVATACAKQNFKPVIVIPNFDVAMLPVDALQGSEIAFSDVPFNQPAAADFRAAVKKYNPGLPKQAGYGQFSYAAWLSGQAVAKAILNAKLGGKQPTRADVFKGLYKFKNETLGGGAPNLTFTKGKVPVVPCGYSGTIKGGKLVFQPGAVCA